MDLSSLGDEEGGQVCQTRCIEHNMLASFPSILVMQLLCMKDLCDHAHCSHGGLLVLTYNFHEGPIVTMCTRVGGLRPVGRLCF